MKPALVVVADLGNFKAYHWDGNELHSTPRLELIDAFETVDARSKRIRNTMTVLEGRSANGGSNPKLAGAGSDGEQHNMHLEKRRRLVRQMAEGLTALLKPKQIERCFFAAPQEPLRLRPGHRLQISAHGFPGKIKSRQSEKKHVSRPIRHER